MVHGAGLLSLLLSAALVSACASSPLSPDDRAGMCHVVVETLPGAFAFKANPAAGPVKGPLVGAAAGLLLLPAYGPFAVIAPLAGIKCGVASAKHPEAEAALRAVFETVSEDALARALEGELARRLAECRGARQASGGREPADTVIQIERVEFTWTCPVDRQGYLIGVKWRALADGGSRILADTRRDCAFESGRSVDEWSADPSSARREAQLALAKTGERIALDILDVERPTECRHVPLEPAGDAAGRP